MLSSKLVQFSVEKYHNYGPTTADYLSQAYHSKFTQVSIDYSIIAFHKMKSIMWSVWKYFSTTPKPKSKPKETPLSCFYPTQQQVKQFDTILVAKSQCSWKDKETVDLVHSLGEKMFDNAVAQIMKEYQKLNQSLQEQHSVLHQEIQEQQNWMQELYDLQQTNNGTRKSMAQKRRPVKPQVNHVDLNPLKEQLNWIASQVGQLVNRTAEPNNETTRVKQVGIQKEPEVVQADYSLKWYFYVLCLICVVLVSFSIISIEMESWKKGKANTFYTISNAHNGVNVVLLGVQGAILGTILSLILYHFLLPACSTALAALMAVLFYETITDSILSSKQRKLIEESRARNLDLPKGINMDTLKKLFAGLSAIMVINGMLLTNSLVLWISVPLLLVAGAILYMMIKLEK